MAKRELIFKVYGNPVPYRERAAVSKSGKVFSYRPPSVQEWQRCIRDAAARVQGGEPLFKGPLSLQAVFYFLKPKSKPKKVTRPTVRPDIDNLLKAVQDSLQGIVFANDAQVVEAFIQKAYGDPPRVELRVGDFPF